VRVRRIRNWPPTFRDSCLSRIAVNGDVPHVIEKRGEPITVRPMGDLEDLEDLTREHGIAVHRKPMNHHVIVKRRADQTAHGV
jgi:hypothetical protein